MPLTTRRTLAVLAIALIAATALLPGLRRSSAQGPGDIGLSAAAPEAAHGAGALVVHRVTITNSDEIPMMVTFEVEGGTWEVDVPKSMTLDGLTTQVVDVPVRVPRGASDTARDATRLKITGRSDGPFISRSLDLTSWTGGRYAADAFTGCRFDLNGDGLVDDIDVNTVRDAFGSRAGAEGYDPMIDMDHDGRIGASDVQSVAGHRRTCGPTNTHDTGDIESKIDSEKIRVHLEALQAIADANGDNRAFNTAGYDASVDYIVEMLSGTEFIVTTPEFIREQSEDLSPARVERITDAGAIPLPESDVRSLAGSANGDVTALAQAVDLVLPPGPEADTSTSGCETEDFAGFEPGRIAVIQRGTCQFGVKATNAIAAGAVGVLIFNEGQDGRTAVFSSSVGETKSIPFISTSFAIGEEIAGLLTGGEDVTLRLQVNRGIIEVVQRNVIAEWPYGDPSRVMMSGAHLDSVPAGPGINDNGTGTSTLLQIALTIDEMELRPENRIRVGWWAAEEIGLVGSRAWVAQQKQGELDRIVAYFNYDMVGSPNWIRGVYDGDGAVFPAGSGEIEATHRRYLDGRELAHVPTVIGSRSDHAGFLSAGIPAGGLFTGAETPKTAEQFALFGGEEGVALDACYHRACDTIENVAFDVLDEMADTIAHVLISYSHDPVFGLAALGDSPRPGVESVARRLDALGDNPGHIGQAIIGSPKGIRWSVRPSTLSLEGLPRPAWLEERLEGVDLSHGHSHSHPGAEVLR